MDLDLDPIILKDLCFDTQDLVSVRTDPQFRIECEARVGCRRCKAPAEVHGVGEGVLGRPFAEVAAEGGGEVFDYGRAGGFCGWGGELRSEEGFVEEEDVFDFDAEC